MVSRMDEFRTFINKYPKIRTAVTSNKMSWQQVYENWVILGENDSIWNEYRDNGKTINQSGKLDELLSTTNIKSIIEYVKKINPDTISKTLNTVQKVLQITQSFGSKPTPGLYNANYNSWWD